MSLRTRLLILVIAAMLVPAILVGLRFVQNRTSEIDAALANLSATANDIRAISMRKFRARPSFTMASPAPAISTPATRRPVRPSCRPCAKNTRSSPAY